MREEDQGESTSLILLNTSDVRKRRKVQRMSSTTKQNAKQEAIQSLCHILKDKYRKPVLSNEEADTVIFNLCSQLCIDDVQQVLRSPHVEVYGVKLFCNQYSLTLEVKLDLSRKVKLKEKPHCALNLAELREFAKAKTYDPPPISSCLGYLHHGAYETLNAIAEVIHFVLFTGKVKTESSIYQNKKPFYNVIVRIAADQVIPANLMLQLKKLTFEKGKLKTVSLVFDKTLNSMKVIIRVKL